MSKKIKTFRILVMAALMSVIIFGSVSAKEGIDNGIPVVYINIDETDGHTIEDMNGSEDHSVRCYGNIDVKVPEGYISPYTGSAVADMNELKLEFIRGRGNSTWKLDKKPYTIKLDKKADLLGMGSNKNWVLLANRMDTSKMRNMLTFMLADALDYEFTPKAVPVEVVMNGEYLGTYQLSESIKVGKNRINIDELEEDENDPEKITGGYLLAIGGQKDELPEATISTNSGQMFVLESPEFENGKYENEAQKNYISDYLQKTEDAIFECANGDFADRSYTDYIDVDSAIDIWWMQELSKNPDAFMSGSNYLYKKRDGKLYFGPVWDFDIAWDSTKTTEPVGDIFLTKWLVWMFTDPEICNMAKDRWSEISEKLDEMLAGGGAFDAYAAQIKESWIADYKIWGKITHEGGEFGEGDGEELSEIVENNANTDNAEEVFETELQALKEWLLARKEYIDNHLEEVDHIADKVIFMDGDTEVGRWYVTYIGSLNDIPKAPEKEGMFFLGWFDEAGNECDFTEDYKNDTVFYAKYIEDDKVIRGDVLYFKQDEVWYADDDWISKIQYTLLPENAQDTRIIWSSSDEDVIKVDEEGMPEITGIGKAVITATVGSGKKYSMTVNTYKRTEDLENADVEELVVDNLLYELKVGEYAHINTSVKPYYAWNNISFESKDESIASVDENGVIKGLAVGETKIIVKEDDSEKTVECIVRVGMKKEEEKKDNTPEEKDGNKSPETGDSRNMTILFVISFMSVLAAYTIKKSFEAEKKRS